MNRPKRWIRYVDLTRGEIRSELVEEKTDREFLGGSGVGWKLMADHLPPGVDPLSPENLICINPGILVGTLTVGAPKTTVITKFPTTASEDGKHYVGSCTTGGRYLGIALNRAGCHHLLITGKAEKPVYLRIRDDRIEGKRIEKDVKDVRVLIVLRAGPAEHVKGGIPFQRRFRFSDHAAGVVGLKEQGRGQDGEEEEERLRTGLPEREQQRGTET